MVKSTGAQYVILGHSERREYYNETPEILKEKVLLPSPLLELAQTHVHRVNDAIQASHPLSSSSPPAFNLSQHQGLFE